MEESPKQDEQNDIEAMFRQFEYNESNTIRYAESAARFCEDAESLKEKFLEDFECWHDPENGDVHYLSKNDRVDLIDREFEIFPFERCCDSLYVSWRAASLQNKDVKEFNGIRLHELSGAIRAVPRDGLLLGRAYELFDSEVKFLRLLVNSREGIDDKAVPESPDAVGIKTMRGTSVLESELTREERKADHWLAILGYNHAKQTIDRIARSSFYTRIEGKGAQPLDAFKTASGKYRIREQQLPSGSKSEGSRNAIVEQYELQKQVQKDGNQTNAETTVTKLS